MWSRTVPTMTESEIATPSPEVAVEIPSDQRNNDLKAMLQGALGEKYLEFKPLAAGLCKGELTSTDFHIQVQALSLPSSVYREVVLSFPDMTKRAELLALLEEEIKRTAKATTGSAADTPLQNATMVESKNHGENESSEKISNDSEAGKEGKNDSNPVKDDSNAETVVVEGDGGDITQNENIGDKLQASKEAVRLKEKQLSSTLAERRVALSKEQRVLAAVSAELDELATSDSRDIGLARKTLEDLDRQLASCTKDFAEKEVAYLKAKALVEKKQHSKELLIEHLNILLWNIERRKEEKLNSLMKQMDKGPITI